MWLNIIQIILALAIIALILIQAKGSGLGSTFGGQSASYHSKRGVEKVVYSSTIISILLFVIVAIINVWL